jgi:quercetin dioxygenase-like cupin family protein
MKRLIVLALSITSLFAIYLSASALATNRATTPPVTTTILGKSLFDEIELNAHTIPANLWQARLKTQGLSDVYVVDNKIPAGGSTGWHSHPGPSLILVVSGTITNYHGDDPTCTPQVYTAGSGFVDAGGDDVHILRNESAAPAETIAVQLLPTGSARKVDKPNPGNCQF